MQHKWFFFSLTLWSEYCCHYFHHILYVFVLYVLVLNFAHAMTVHRLRFTLSIYPSDWSLNCYDYLFLCLNIAGLLKFILFIPSIFSCFVIYNVCYIDTYRRKEISGFSRFLYRPYIIFTRTCNVRVNIICKKVIIRLICEFWSLIT